MNGSINGISILASEKPLTLVADVQYMEPYGSTALNRKLKNIVKPGFYAGFNPAPGNGLNLVITSASVNNKGAASIDVNDVQITVQQISDVIIPVKTGVTSIIVLEANYTFGVRTQQVDNTSSVPAAQVLALVGKAPDANQIEICRVTVPANATKLTLDMIDVSRRVTREIGVRFSSSTNSTEEHIAANSLALKKLRDEILNKNILKVEIGTSGAKVPLLNGSNTWSAKQTFSGGLSGTLSGNASTATKLQNARSIQVKLDSGSAVNFDGTANIQPGITGKLGLANGGTGATDAADARNNLGLKSAALKNTGTSGDAVPLLNGANTWSAKQTFSGGLSGALTGNASTSTRLQTARKIGGVVFDGSADINLPGVNAAGNQSTSGNAGSATKLNSRGNLVALANAEKGDTGLSMYLVNNNGYPIPYGNLIHLGGSGSGELLIGWSGTDGVHAPSFIRSKRDIGTAKWSEWAQIFTSKDKVPGVNSTGNQATSGNAGSATKLQSARSIQVKLDSGSAANFDGTANIQPGITGKLGLANGGTGATDAAGARKSLGLGDIKPVIALPEIGNGNVQYLKIATVKNSGNNAGFFQLKICGAGGYGNPAQNLDYVTVSCRGVNGMTSANVNNYINHATLSHSDVSALKVIAAPSANAGEFDIYLCSPNGWWKGVTMQVCAMTGGDVSGAVKDGSLGNTGWTSTAPAKSFAATSRKILTEANIGTSGAKVPLLNGANTWSARQTFTGGLSGTLTGNASTATKLQNARSIQVKLDSGSAANFDGMANIQPGITGKLGLANGGTGATDAAGARNNLGLKSAALKNTGTSGDAVPLLNASNIWSGDQYFNSVITGKVVKASGVVSYKPASQGAHISWNRESGSGRMEFINHRGGGKGGFNFWNGTESPVLIASIDESGSAIFAGGMTLGKALSVASGGTGASDAAGARNNLGLKGAATRDVGSGSGQVMPVGAFGLGGSGIIVSADSDGNLLQQLKTKGSCFTRATANNGKQLSVPSHGSGFFSRSGDTNTLIIADYGTANITVLAANDANIANPRVNRLYGTANKPTASDVGLGSVANAKQLVASSNLSDVPDKAVGRNNLGLKSAALKNTGTSGDAVPLLNGSNTWSAKQVFNGGYSGKLIAANIGDKKLDLNTLTIKGGQTFQKATYQCPTMGGGNNISNKPSGVSGNFILYVESLRQVAETDWVARQTLISGDTKIVYSRYDVNGTWSPWVADLKGVAAIGNGGTGATDAAGARNNLGLKSAALKSTGTSGDAVPLLNGANTWSAKQVFSSGTIEVKNNGNSHLFFLNASGQEKGLVYADDSKNVHIRAGGSGGKTWDFWSSGSCQFPGALTANGAISSQSGGVVATTNYPAGKPNGTYNNTAGVVSRFSNGAYANLYFQEFVGNYHQGIINVNGFGKDDSWYFRAGGEFYCNGNGNFNDVYIRSDKRSKENIRIIEDACDKISRISGNVYELKTPDGGTVISGGVIAQEVLEVLPDAVTKDREEDGGLYRVNYNTIIALLVEVVKEQSERLKNLESVMISK